LLVEVHPHPEKAFSDGAQSLTVPDFQRMMSDLRPYIKLWSEARVAETAAAV
jgi:3-deoxy-7-phosphoheptulonate synthase